MLAREPNRAQVFFFNPSWDPVDIRKSMDLNEKTIYSLCASVACETKKALLNKGSGY